MRRGEEERPEPHQHDPGPDPDRLGPRAPAPEVADRQQEQERGDVVTVGDEACLGRADAESV